MTVVVGGREKAFKYQIRDAKCVRMRLVRGHYEGYSSTSEKSDHAVQGRMRGINKLLQRYRGVWGGGGTVLR